MSAAQAIEGREALEARYSGERDKLLRHLRKAHKGGALRHEAFRQDDAWAAILDALRRFDPSQPPPSSPMLAPERAKKFQDACDAITAALAEPVVVRIMDWSMEGSEGFDAEEMARTIAQFKRACRFATAPVDPKGGTPKRTFFTEEFFIALTSIFKRFAGMAPCPDGVVGQGPFVDLVEDVASTLSVECNCHTIMRYLRNYQKAEAAASGS